MHLVDIFKLLIKQIVALLTQILLLIIIMRLVDLCNIYQILIKE